MITCFGGCKKEGILLTGGTGFLGTELAARLVKAEEAFVYVLVRAADGEKAAQRLRAAWQHDQSLYQAVGQRLLPLPILRRLTWG